jgi:acyl-CoA dehydrogenase
MVALIWVLALLIAVCVLAYQRASLAVVTVAVTVLMLVLSALTQIGWLALIVIWALWLGFAALLNIRPIRRWLISAPIAALLARHIPPFSETEQAVLAAGNVGWERELFSGMPDLQQLAQTPWVTLRPDEQAFLDGPVTQLCALLNPWQINQEQQVPQTVWDSLKQQGFFGLVIPTEYGGKGFSAFAHGQVILKIASVSTAVATIVSVPNSLGPAELLLHYGTPEQKQYYLPRLAAGKEIPCFALTSPVAGSDAAAITDSGVVCRYQKNGQDILGIRLNWQKRYITLSPVATLLGLAFRLYDPDHLLGDKEDLGITCALVPTQTPGVQVGRRHDPLCCAFPNGPTVGVDVLVALDAIIGGIAQAGKGWQMLMERLAAGRSISLPSIAMGGIKIAAAATGAYARIRRQFSTDIGDFGGVQAVLARMLGQSYMAESLRLFSLAQVDQGIHSATAAAISKYHVTELSRRIVSGAMDIHGGKGICRGPSNYLAQLHIESPIAITVEGANILTRSLIIFGQGALRCHPFLQQEINALQHKDKKAFDHAFFAHIGYFINHKVRAFILGLIAVSKKNHRRQLLRFSAALALTADLVFLSVGAALKRKELLSARLGDLLSDLYMVSAILRHQQETPENKEMSLLAAWGCQTLFAHWQCQFFDLLANLPNRLVAFALRVAVFPLGKQRFQPNDRLTVSVAKLFMTPGAVRNQLGSGAYFGGVLSDLENQLEKIIQIEPLLKILHHAKRQHIIHGHQFSELLADAIRQQVLTEEQGQQIQQAEDIRSRFIQVDDFSGEYNG